MSEKHSFESVAERILRGEASIPGISDVPAWPVASVLSDCFVVLMHAELPGCVALVGEVGKRVVLVGAYSERLKNACAEQHAESFKEADFKSVDAGALVVLLGAIAECVAGRREINERFLEIPGVEGAELLRQLAVFWRSRSMGALH